jgi:SPP1 gp7 family putative phage head morphogenesis protein
MKQAEKMLAELSVFLADFGHLPALKEIDDDLRQAEERLTRQMRRLFENADHLIIAKLRELGYIPNDPDRRRRLLLDVMGFLLDEFPELVALAAIENAEVGRLLTFRDIEGFGMTISFTEFDRWTRDRIRDKTYVFSQETANRIIGDVAENLARSYEDGLGIDEGAKRLRQEFASIHEYRLRTIARTEIQTAQNEGAFETMKELGVAYKQWITARDSRVRHQPQDKADHRVLHGQIVRLDERFSNGLLFPGDRAGPIAEWVNCRCRIRPYIPRNNEIITATPYYP